MRCSYFEGPEHCSSASFSTLLINGRPDKYRVLTNTIMDIKTNMEEV